MVHPDTMYRGTKPSGVVLLFMFYIDFTWNFSKIGVPKNGWFRMENLIKMDDLGVPLFLGNTHLEMSQKTSADNRENFVILPNFPTVNLRCKDLTFIRRICILKFHPYQGHLTKTAWVVPLDPEISSCKKPFIHASEQFILPEANSESSPLEINDWKMKFPFWGIAFKK